MFLILRPESQEAFLPVCLGFPFRDSLKMFYAFPQLFQLFTSSQLLSSSLGKFRFFLKNLNLKLTIFQGFFERLWGNICLIHPHRFSKWSHHLIFGQSAPQYFIHFLNKMFNYIHKIIILWVPLPLGCKVQVSNFKMQSHELGVLHIPPLKANTILGVDN